jgi:O-antigen/teichoic acid export membrane protein
VRPRRVPAPPSARKAEDNLLRLAGGSSLVFAGGWVAYVLSLAFHVVVARQVGASSFGSFTLGLTVTTVLAGIAPLGRDQAVVRYVAVYRGQEAPQQVRGTVRFGVRATLGFGSLLTAAVLLLATPAASLFHDERLEALLRVLAFAIPLTATTDLVLGSVQAHTRVASTMLIRSFATPGLRVLAAMVALLVAKSVVGVAVAYTLGEGVALGMAVLAARRVLPGSEMGRAEAPGPEVARFARPLAANRLLSSVNNKTEVFFLGALRAAGHVALFAASRRFTVVAGSIFAAVNMLFNPMASDLYAACQHEQLARLYKTVSRWVFSIGFFVFLVQVLFGRLLLGAFGQEFRDATLALAILACGQLVNYATGTAGSMLLNIGRSRLALANSAGALPLSVALDLVLVARYGLIGAAVANSTALVALQLARLIEVWRITGMHPYSASFVKPVGAGLAAVLLTWWLDGIAADGRLHPVARLGVLVAAYAVGLVAFGFDADDRMVAGRVLRRLRRSRSGARAFEHDQAAG